MRTNVDQFLDLNKSPNFCINFWRPETQTNWLCCRSRYSIYQSRAKYSAFSKIRSWFSWPIVYCHLWVHFPREFIFFSLSESIVPLFSDSSVIPGVRTSAGTPPASILGYESRSESLYDTRNEKDRTMSYPTCLS